MSGNTIQYLTGSRFGLMPSSYLQLACTGSILWLSVSHRLLWNSITAEHISLVHQVKIRTVSEKSYYPLWTGSQSW